MKEEEKELMEAVLAQLERLNNNLIKFSQQISMIQLSELEDEEEFVHPEGPCIPMHN